MLLICVSLKLSKDRTRALVYSHGVGAGRRTSTTGSGHGSTETLNDDLTPEDFHRNNMVHRCSANAFSRSWFAFLIEPNIFQIKV